MMRSLSSASQTGIRPKQPKRRYTSSDLPLPVNITTLGGNTQSFPSCSSHCSDALPQFMKHSSSALLPRAPIVSTPTGTNQKDCARLAYLTRFFSALHATTLGPLIVLLRWLVARVSGHVKSHARHRQFFHGVNDIPSGRRAICGNSEVRSSLVSMEFRPTIVHVLWGH